MGDFRKKKKQKQKQEQSNFGGKDFFMEIPEEKNLTLKKISFMALNVEKNLTHLLVTEKKFNSIARGLAGKNSYPNQITHTPPPPSPPPAPSKVKWSVPTNPNETSHIPKQLLH